MSAIENHAGLNISNSGLQVVEVNIVDDEFQLVNVDESAFTEIIDFENDGISKINSIIQDAFEKLQLRKKLNCLPVSFSFPDEITHSIIIPFDKNLHHHELIKYIEWEFSVLQPYLKTNDLVIRYFETKSESNSNSGELLVFAFEKKYFSMLDSFCIKNGLILKHVDNSSISAERTLPSKHNQLNAEITLSVCLDDKFISFFLLNDNRPFFYRAYIYKSTNDILKLFDEIFSSQALNKLSSQLSSVYLSGSGLTKILVQILNSSFVLDFIEFNPFDKIKPSPMLYENKLFLEKYGSFAAAAGLVLKLY